MQDRVCQACGKEVALGKRMVKGQCNACDLRERTAKGLRKPRKRLCDMSKIKGTGIDRKDNSLGYTAENSVPCCGPCNAMKMDNLTYDEMKAAMATVLAMRALRAPCQNEVVATPEAAASNP